MGNQQIVEKDIKNNPPLPGILDIGYSITAVALIRKVKLSFYCVQ
jgi:hypothetical protein